MRQTRLLILLSLLVIGLGAVVPADAAIRRVAARYNMVDFYGGYASPHGEYDEVGLVRFIDEFDRPLEIDADLAYNSGWYLGFNYGTLYADHVLMQIGFRFINHDAQDWFKSHPDEFNLRQYDLNFNLNLYPISPAESFIAPFGGVGLQAGLLSTEVAGYDDESQLTLLAAVNFGADLKVAEFTQGRSFLTLSSINSYDLFGSDDRPKYLNIGGGLRYWFR